MITAITIENFKGIGERVELELRPLTLMFGPNSSGKSTVLHALQYLAEVVLQGNLDPDRTSRGGKSLDLGGFQQLVHQHDLERTVRIAVRVDLADELESGTFNAFDFDWSVILDVLGLESNSDLLECFGDFQRAEIEYAIQWSSLEQRPYVIQVDYRADDAKGGPVAALATWRSDPAGRRRTLQIFDHNPSMFPLSNWRPGNDDDSGDHHGKARDARTTLLSECLQIVRQLCEVDGDNAFYLPSHAMGPTTSLTPFVFLCRRENVASESDLGLPSDAADNFVMKVSMGVGWLLEVVHNHVRTCLEQFRSIGPLRELPARNARPPRTPDTTRWGSGLGAWDRLFADEGALLDAVNSWLGDSNRLNTGYRLRAKRYKEVDLSDRLLADLISGRAFDDVAPDARLALERLPTQTRLLIEPVGEDLELAPCDVGVGISQIIPVVVAALDGSGHLNAIEQPELHVHPRIQAELGDLFIEAVQTKNHRFLIETHSEHLILRLQRRIRETTAGRVANATPLSSEDLVVYYLRRESGATVVRRIDVDRDGEFVQPWPDDFFDIDFYERFSK
jgi:hypothetical protein